MTSMRRRMLDMILATCVAALMATTAAVSSTRETDSLSPSPSDLAKQVRTYIAPYVETNQFAGTLLIAHGDQILVHEAFGLADRALGVPCTVNTRFRVGSITKDFTAALILELQDEGLLSTDDPLEKYLPNFPRADRITIENLLTHTHGIPDWRELPHADELGAVSTSLQTAIKGLAELQPEFPPGTRRHYGSSGYLILARVVELVTGQSYGDALRTRILTPLELRDTGSLEGLDIVPGLARSYVPTGRPPWLRYPVAHNPTIRAGSASLWSTAMDLFHWSQSEQALRLAWGEGQRGERAYLWTNGMSAGFVARIARYPQDHWTIVLLSNIFIPAFRPIFDDLAGIIFGETVLPPAVWHPVTLHEDERAALPGSWKCENDFHFSVEQKDGALEFVTGGSRLPLQPRSDHLLFLPTDFATISFSGLDHDGFEQAHYAGGFDTTCSRERKPVTP